MTKRAELTVSKMMIAFTILSLVLLGLFSFYSQTLADNSVSFGAGFDNATSAKLEEDFAKAFNVSKSINDAGTQNATATFEGLQDTDSNVFWRGVKAIQSAVGYITRIPFYVELIGYGLWAKLPPEFYSAIMVILGLIIALVVAGAFWRWKFA